jgi:hypothetical protein
MRLWARIGLAFLVGFGLLVALQLIKPKPQISISCTTKGGTGDCVVDNRGGQGADVDVNVVLVCRDGEHVAHISARVDPRNHTTKVIEEFEPSVGIFTKCVGIDYKDMLVRSNT